MARSYSLFSAVSFLLRPNLGLEIIAIHPKTRGKLDGMNNFR
jgi:hypothetical protein